ncbi:hypothetical protein MASR1M46_19090 [Bacteroidales bacterium]
MSTNFSFNKDKKDDIFVITLLNIHFKTMKTRIASITLALLTTLSLTIFAQPKQIVLSHYIFPEFTEGYVMMKGGRTQQMLLNYNSVTEEMVFKRGETILAIGKAEVKEVEYVTISGRKFVVLNDKFLELLFEGGKNIYAEHRCTVIPPGNPAPYGGTSQVSSVDRYSGLSADGGLYYKLQLPDGYVVKPAINYVVRAGDKISKIYSLKQLRKVYQEKRDEFDKYVKDNNVKFDNITEIAALTAALE